MNNKKMYMLLVMMVLMYMCTACGNIQKESLGSGEIETESIEKNGSENTETKSGVEQTEEPEKVDSVEIHPIDMSGEIEETILVDNNNVKITANRLIYTDYSVDMEITIENNCNQDISVASGTVGYCCNSINGYMIDSGYLSTDVVAGKKSNETISFPMDELMIYGMTSVADIQVGFSITDADYNTIFQGYGQVKTSQAENYDYGEDTYQTSINSGILAAVYDYKIDYYSGEELYNEGDIKITSEALITNKEGKKAILLEVENNTSELIYGTSENVSLNGLVVYSYAWSDDAICPGTRRVINISLADLLNPIEWETLGFSGVESFIFDFGVKDSAHNDITIPKEVNILFGNNQITFDDSGKELYNKNEIKVISKGIVQESENDMSDVHLLMIVENNSSEKIELDDEMGSLSINGYMLDCLVNDIKLSGGKSALLDIEINQTSLEENGISNISEIKEAELTVNIKTNSSRILDHPIIKAQY